MKKTPLRLVVSTDPLEEKFQRIMALLEKIDRDQREIHAEYMNWIRPFLRTLEARQDRLEESIGQYKALHTATPRIGLVSLSAKKKDE